MKFFSLPLAFLYLFTQKMLEIIVNDYIVITT